MRDVFGKLILNFLCRWIGRVVELQHHQKAGERGGCGSKGWLPPFIRAGHGLTKNLSWKVRLRADALAVGSASELDPSSELDHGPDFSEEKQAVPLSLDLPRFPTDSYLPTS